MQAEVKKFLRDPNRGRVRQQRFFMAGEEDDDAEVSLSEEELEDSQRGYIDLERHASLDEETTTTPVEAGGSTSASGSTRAKDEAEGRNVDVVLSDMSAPWEQTTGFWKRSLSEPYSRMMNTSGLGFRDHAGSMVCPASTSQTDILAS